MKTTAAKDKVHRNGEELEVLNMLCQPVWVFDITNKAMWWANNAAVELWDASSLEDLLARDFAHDMSTSTERRLNSYLEKFETRGEQIADEWTFYPNGKSPKPVVTTSSGIRIEDGRMAALLE